MSHIDESTNTENDGTRVFLVEDDEAIRNAISCTLENADYEITSFHSSTDFLQFCSPEMTGCLILDLCLPGMNGLELYEELKKQKIDLPFVVVSGSADVTEAISAFRLGAVDFLQKPIERCDLLHAVKSASEKATQEQRRKAEREEVSSRLARLTPREREIVQLVTEGLGTKGIASELEISTKTVQHHRARVLEKLDVENVPKLLKMMRVFEN